MKYLLSLLLLPMYLSCSAEKEDPGEWPDPRITAEWISAADPGHPYDTTTPAPVFRKEFDVNGPVRRARAIVTGVGYFEFFLNGHRVGDHLLDPAVTRYDKRVMYQVFDITPLLERGRNAAGAMVGNGFYNIHTRSAWDFRTAPWRSCPALLCQIEIEYRSGKSVRIVSGPTWKWSTGPIRFDQIRNGEYYDARLEMEGWSVSGFDDSRWNPAVAGHGPEGVLTQQRMPPIRKCDTLQPVFVTEPVAGVYLVDFGRNIAGWARLRVNEPEGNEIVMRYGERIHADGTLDQEELSRFIFTGETQTTRYISSGRPGQLYEPRFVYFGFQYVEIEGLSRPPAPGDLEAYMIHTDFERTGYFGCSDTLLNRLQENIESSFLGNFHSFPEDCPHREKMGWTGDAQLVVRTGLYNFDTRSAYRKWMHDHMDEQRPGGDLPGIIPTSGWGYERGRDPETRPFGYGPHWEGSSVVIPWQLYRFTGDTSVLEEFYPMMKRYLAHLESVSTGHLLNFGIDDHKSIRTHTGGGYISSAYFCMLADIMEQCGGILGKEADAGHFRQLGNRIADAFHREYFDSTKQIYGNGGQTQMGLALGCGIVPEEHREEVVNSMLKRIREDDYHFDCGVVGLRMVIDVLLENNRPDILHRMIRKEGFPSFSRWIELGATTMWQNWDGSQSRNHIMFGSIGDYFYGGLAGIRPEEKEPGFRKIILHPYFPDEMTYLRCGHRCPQGWVRTSWMKERGILTYEVTLPEGTVTDLVLPFDRSQVTIGKRNLKDGNELKISEPEPGTVRLMLPPGSYTFRVL